MFSTRVIPAAAAPGAALLALERPRRGMRGRYAPSPVPGAAGNAPLGSGTRAPCAWASLFLARLALRYRLMRSFHSWQPLGPEQGFARRAGPLAEGRARGRAARSLPFAAERPRTALPSASPALQGGKVAGAGEAFWGQDVLARPGEGCWGRQGCCRCLLRPPFRLLGLCSARPVSPHRPPVVPLQDGCCKCSQRLGLKKMGFEGEKRVPGDEARADSLPWHARPRHPLGNGRAAGSSAQRLRPGLETP